MDLFVVYNEFGGDSYEKEKLQLNYGFGRYICEFPLGNSFLMFQTEAAFIKDPVSKTMLSIEIVDIDRQFSFIWRL